MLDGSSRLNAQQPLNRPTAWVHAFLDQIAKTLIDQSPAFAGELFRFTTRQELMKHRIEPVSHDTENSDQSLGFHSAQLPAASGTSQRVVATAFPELDAIGKDRLEAQLSCGPQHGLTTVEVERLNGQQQQIQALERTAAKDGIWQGRIRGSLSSDFSHAAMMAGLRPLRHHPVDLRQFIRDVPDFPKPGILFRDITPLLRAPEGWAEVMRQFDAICERLKPDLIVGIESRGFIVGTAIATRRNLGFVPIRKPGKLPGEVVGIDYALEYGTDRLEIHADALADGASVLLVDDLLATGGTAEASVQLIERAGGQLLGCAFVVELVALEGRKRLPESVAVDALITYS